jgi:hypothetical protein
MCRSIKKLRTPEGVTEDEIEAAARQFVRKVSGFHKPSRQNEEVFDAAVAEIASTTRALLDQLVVRAPARPLTDSVAPDGDNPPATASAPAAHAAHAAA